VKDQQEFAKKHAGGIYTSIAPIFHRSFRISPLPLEGLVGSTLVGRKIRVVAIELRENIDRLNSLIDVKGPADEIQWSEIIQALHTVHDRAVELQDAIARESR
jgi:hypothetical protein